MYIIHYSLGIYLPLNTGPKPPRRSYQISIENSMIC